MKRTKINNMGIDRGINRGTDKSLDVTPKVSGYIKELLFSAESQKVRKLLSAHDTGDRAYLHIPYSEARFLEACVQAIKAKRVLEIGTFKGYSTAFLARGLPAAGGEVITIDEDKRYVAEATAFWKHMGVQKKIKFKLGLAEEILKNMAGTAAGNRASFLEYFDLIFIDADKENYKRYMELSFKLLKKGGTILIDNTLWRGLPAEAQPEDNGAKHMKAFNAWLFKKYGKNASIVPAWDGLSIVVKK